jgi:hypothetical protein
MDNADRRSRALCGTWLAISSVVPLSYPWLDPYLFAMAALVAAGCSVVVFGIALRRAGQWRWALLSAVPSLLAVLLIFGIRWA